MVDARHFLWSTDYPADQVVYLKTGSMTVNASSSGTATIPHGLPFIPLCQGNWSLASDFTTSYEYSTGPLSSPLNPAAIYSSDAVVYSDATNVYIGADNPTASAIILYYRVYAFQPSDSNADIAPIANQGDRFILNTDYNLTKLFMEGTQILPATTGAGGQVNIIHGLGYIPQAQAWIKGDTGLVSPAPSSFGFASSTVVSPGTNLLAFGIGTFNLAQQMWYRIYADD